MMTAKDTRFSAVKAFVHWWLLGVAGLVPTTWVAEAMPTRELQAVCYGASLVWFVLAAWIVGRRGERYTKRVVPMSATAMAASIAADRIDQLAYEASEDDARGYWVLYGDR